MERALVTGSAGAIGRAIAQRLRTEGWEVIGVDLAHGDGDGDGTVVCDVSDRTAVETLGDAVGTVDLLVNNAGIWRFAPLEDVDPRDFERVLQVNLLGPFHLTQVFGRPMLDRGGSIVNVVSVAANHQSPFVGAYSSSKAALVALTRQTAYEWGPRGVRTNAVGPGVIQTDAAGMYHDPEVVRGRAAAVPLRRLGVGDDVAKVVAWLASDGAGYVNGQVVYVDGGLSTALMGILPRPPGVPSGTG